MIIKLFTRQIDNESSDFNGIRTFRLFFGRIVCTYKKMHRSTVDFSILRAKAVGCRFDEESMFKILHVSRP